MSSTSKVPLTAAEKEARLQAMMAMQTSIGSAMGKVVLASSSAIGMCDHCNMPIPQGGQLVRAFDKDWNAAHLVCSVCNNSLSASSSPTYLQGVLYCDRHDPKRQSQLPTCASCDLPISDVMVDALNKKWHRDCFNCTACDIPLTTNYVAYESMPYCREDYYQRAGLVCGVCGENIEAEYIEIFGRKYHTHCKNCDQCGKNLAGRHYFSLNGSVMCMEHRDELVNCRQCHLPIDGRVLVGLKS